MVKKLNGTIWILALFICSFGLVNAEGIYPEHVQIMATSYSDTAGSPFVLKNYGMGRVWWPIDSVIDADRETLWTYSIPTAHIGTMQSIVSIVAEDSSYTQDSAYIRLYTTFERNNTSKTRLIYSESLAVPTVGTYYYDYGTFDADTMFWAESYWVVIFADSTGGAGSAAKARTATLATPRKYCVKFDYITRSF